MLRAAVLAGGKSSRMGQDKALLQWQGDTLLQRAIALLQQTGANEVLVSGRDGIADLLPHCGPPGAVLSLLNFLHERDQLDGAPLLLIPVDMPLLTLPTLQLLLQRIVPGHGTRFRNQIFPCILPASAGLFLHLQQLFKDARHLGGQRSLRALLEFTQAEPVDDDAIPAREFRNFNTPSEWESLNHGK
jgi:molybdopterin-guanine dinucleotide biosynthesis protein A